MIDQNVLRRLQPVASRLRQARLMTSLAVVWFVAAAIGLALLYATHSGLRWGLGSTRSLVPMLTATALLGAIVSAWLAMRSARDYRQLAWRIEAAYPDLNNSLITAVTQQPGAQGQYGYLQQEVIRSVALHSYRHPWSQLVPTSRLAAAHLANVLGLLALAGVLLALFFLSPLAAEALPGFDFNDVAVATEPSYQVSIEPGHTELERGTSLLVLARFVGTVPPEASLVYQTAGEESQEQQQIAMSRSLDDPLLGGRIAAVDQPLAYWVEYGDQRSETYQVTLFEYPRLERADAQLTFPSYTGLEAKLVQDVRRVSAVEGTRVILQCYLNKPVATAELRDRQGQTMPLTATSEPLLYESTIELSESLRLQLHMTDEAGRANQTPPEFVINALPNQPPDLKLVFPARDMQVSPLEELDLQATAWDDYGLTRVGLSYARPGGEAHEVELGTELPAKQKVPLAHMLSLEAMQAEPDQLVSYYFWAEDMVGDSQVRRTYSDMYFAEVRPFEEIFRQGQQPTDSQMQQQQQGQQGNQNAQQAEQLAELQKQIIAATWKVIRRETRDQPTSRFAEDMQLLTESQRSALEQAQALAEELQDQQSLTHVKTVTDSMQQAAMHLEQAGSSATVTRLPTALQAEQTAYQGLLRLRAREHEVVQSNQQQSSSSSSASSRSQQQLDQLQLDEDQNRYETEQTAPPEQNQEQQEDRQVLNRLRELAQRQNDLNERIKEMQSALEEAESQAEREEIERQLKRLREEQQQILRDTEELQQRMEQPENQQRMSQERQQLQQARENARQSSQSLEEGKISQAAAEGERAERELRELQEEFQKRTSNQFSEEVRQMQQQARELQQREEQLAEELEQVDDQPAEPSLRETDPREPIAQELDRQQQRVEELLERMRQTVEEAEETEPLLAEALYETIRDARQENVQQSLESARQSLERGFVDDARNRERQAREGIQQLGEGIERAAESVLGDETEALRRAEQQLEQLGEELAEEIDGKSERGTGKSEGERSEEGEPSGEGQPSEGEPGEQSSAEGQPSEGQPSEGQPSEGQPSEGQPSEGQPSEGQQPGQEGQPQQGQAQQGQPQDGQSQQPSPGQQGQPGQGQPREGQPGSPQSAAAAAGGGLLEQFLQGDDRRAAPLTGEDFLDWSDRLRDVEEILNDPELRAEAARIRDRAKAVRKEVKRHSAEPNWDIVEEMIAQPLTELRQRVAEELLRRTSDQARVPLNRDPVPGKYEKQVERYYQRLGTGQ